MKLHEFFEIENAGQPDFSAYKKNLEIMLAKPSTILYRGHDHSFNQFGRLMYIENTGRTQERKSVGQSSNILLHHISSWPGVPKRNMSAFATHNKKHSGIFGVPSICVPKDSTQSFAWLEFDLNDAPDGQYLQRIIVSVDSVFVDLKRIREEKRYDMPISKRLINRMQDDNVEIFLDYSLNTPLPSSRLTDMVRFIDNLIIDEQKFRKLANGTAENITENEQDFLNNLESLKWALDISGFLTLADALNDLTAKEAKCVVSRNIKDIPNKIHGNDEEYADEIWFEGPYLLLKTYKSADNSILESALKYADQPKK